MAKRLCTALITPTAIPGALFIAVGINAALVPDEFRKDLPAMLKLWSSVFGMELTTNFFVFVGSCKLFGVASMWGLFGPLAEYICSVLYAILCGCAAYQHHVLNESIAPPIFVGGLCLLRLALALYQGKTKKD